MSDMGGTGIFKCFLKEEIKNILLCICGYAVCAAVLMLYGALDEALIYGGILYFFLIIIVFTVRFVKYVRNISKLQEYLRNSECGPNDGYVPVTLGEKELLDQADRLFVQCGSLKTELKNLRQDYDDYYTVWVHQIKTPIAAMKMILGNEDTKENRDAMSELFRIERYVEMALGYIRLGSDSKDLVIRTYEADDMIRQAIRKFAPMFVGKRLKLQYEPVNIRFDTDEKWFVFVLEQLLSNALKYTAKGQITIKIDGKGRVLISDTGMGIAPEDLPRIFEKGYTGFNGREDKKATGLGLYLCRRVCDMLAISITAQSKVGMGSTFCLDLNQRTLMHD